MSPFRDDFWAVRSAWLIATVLLATLAILLWVIPALFNMHSTPADWLALLLAVITLSLAYLAGRALCRRIITKFGETK